MNLFKVDFIFLGTLFYAALKGVKSFLVWPQIKFLKKLFLSFIKNWKTREAQRHGGMLSVSGSDIKIQVTVGEHLFFRIICCFLGNSLKSSDYYWPLARGTWLVPYSYTGRASSSLMELR